MRIRVDLKTISMANSHSIQKQSSMQDQLQSSLADHYDGLRAQVDQRIDGIEQLLNAQSDQLQASQSNQLGPFYGRKASYTKQRRLRERKKLEGNSPESLGIRVTQITACPPGCPCTCYLQRRTMSPSLVDRVIGQMFVGYSGLPLLNRTCDTASCQKSQAPSVSFEY